MWEAAQGTSSKWSTYLGIDVHILLMPSDTLTRNQSVSTDHLQHAYVWSSEDLEQLQGTAVVGGFLAN